MDHRKIKVIGIGNPLMGDDGVGIAVAERLSAGGLPPGAEVIDGGTGGLTLLGLMEGAGAVILVDAVAMGREPGTVVRFTPGEVRMEQAEGRISLHEPGLPEVLALGEAMGVLPEVVIFGVEPQRVEVRQGLSPPVSAAVEPLAQRILSELRTLLPEREGSGGGG